MHPNKAPGPNGFNPAFFQKCCHLVEVDVVQHCQQWLNCGEFPNNLNDTILQSDGYEVFETIALYNVICKVVVKVLANRLKVFLSKIISPVQSAFILNRLIMDNVLVALEIKLGFASDWIDLILLGVRTCGLRQDNPLLPCLFIICAEDLSSLLRQAEEHGDIHVIAVCKGTSRVSHLSFADNSFFIFKATEEESRKIKSILTGYEEASRQSINDQKWSIMFTPNMNSVTTGIIQSILGVESPIDHECYLGLPSLVGKNKKVLLVCQREASTAA
ncbi:LINE-1 reverse transcriptase isogeny [Gossypium australe]|uniref:LINE-1 reverse transcriptase isogeny n=1 Tax=Gossypium australe TaxID=47621 RepID=A0A5B6VBQ7_9ROSI|nr:LINE-1 reverse transcriptase isogeny [Gossypium australe]